jgi:predicted RNase H-like HicB family nuclease
MKTIFDVIIEKCPDEPGYTAICAELGIVTEGDTMDEVIHRVEEITPVMIDLYMKDNAEDYQKRKRRVSFRPRLRFKSTVVLPQYNAA